MAGLRRTGLESNLLHESCWLGGKLRSSWRDEELVGECWERRSWELEVLGRS